MLLVPEMPTGRLVLTQPSANYMKNTFIYNGHKIWNVLQIILGKYLIHI